jgi:hypothetical protein
MTADTKLIGFWTVLAFLLLAPFMAVAFASYALLYWLDARAKWAAYIWLVPFAFINTLHNWTVCTLLFRELPREFFTTPRLKRWKLSGDPSRRELADMIGGFLNTHDDGHY